MLRLVNDSMSDSLLLIKIDNGFMVLRNSVRSDDVILDLGGSMGRDGAFTLVLGGQECNELIFGRFLQVDFAEAENSVGMKGEDEVSSTVCLLGREDVQRMRRHH